MKPARIISSVLYLSTLLFCLAVSVLPGHAAQENVCVNCHSALPGKYGEPVPLWKTSIHAENSIYATSVTAVIPKTWPTP